MGGQRKSGISDVGPQQMVVGQILGMMVEGMAIRAISRLTGASKNTIVKLLVDAGQACSEYQDRTLRDLKCKRLQLDEIWSFVGAKEKNVPADRKGMGWGDIWTWTAICADSKLIASWMVGDRSFDIEAAHANGLRCLAAGWGYGSEQEWAQADAVAATPAEVFRKISHHSGVADIRLDATLPA